MVRRGPSGSGSDLVSLQPDQRQKIKTGTATVRPAILIPSEFGWNVEAARFVFSKYFQDLQLTR